MLITVDQQGNLVEEVCELFDDGDLGHGNDILGDGVYSNVQSYLETTPGLIKLRVRAATNEMSGMVYSYSQVSNLAVVDEIATETIQQILEFQLLADEKFQEYIATQNFEYGKSIQPFHSLHKVRWLWLPAKPIQETSGCNSNMAWKGCF